MIGGKPPAFVATLSADQTGLVSATPTTVQFDTETYDIGSFFNTTSYEWVPPAGYVNIALRVYGTGTVDTNAGFACYIYKNGAALAFSQRHTLSTAVCGYVEILNYANGTDSYTAVLSMNLSSGNGTVSSDATLTSFQGHWVSP